jgi:hypothetical protein
LPIPREYQTLSLRELSALLRSPWHEERLLALLILVRQYSRAEPADRKAIYRLYMFGLTVGEILRGLEELKTRGMEDCLQLLHFPLGSQIPNIRIVKGALNEAARVYVELVKAGAGLQYLDVSGGLGVDYDGSQTDFESSVNYTLQEYANDVVYRLQTGAVSFPERLQRSDAAPAAIVSTSVISPTISKCMRPYSTGPPPKVRALAWFSRAAAGSSPALRHFEAAR